MIGVGIDAVEIRRFREVLERRPLMVDRLFSGAERRLAGSRSDPVPTLAARFAAKEAAMKALGTGWARGVRWRDIEVANAPGGKPSLHLEGVARQIADRLGVKNISLSITHSGNLALAQVIFES